MKWKITKNVDYHHTNQDYLCLVAEWNGDSNFRCRNGDVHDWLPTDAEMLEGLLKWIEISPTAWQLILENVKPVEKLHQIL